MTDLEQSLITIGGTVVVGVFVYNKWQEYKARKSVERAFSSTHDDVLMSADVPRASETRLRQEPSFDHDPSDAGQVAAADAIGQPEHVAAEPEGNDDFSAPGPKDLPIDDMIDCVIPLMLANRVRGDKILHGLQTLGHAGNKPVHFVGVREDHVWETLNHGGVYVALHAAVQLANRSSALNELEYSELVGRLRQLGDEIDAEADLPDMTEVMKSARALHQLVNQFDAKLSVNVKSNGAPWAIGTLLTALERQGFDVRPDGRLIMQDGDGGVLFSLATNVTLAADTTARLTLLLDVPCVAPQRKAYSAMIGFAKSLATRLGGTVVDDANQPLEEAALAEISDQVEAFFREMDAVGITAGSVRAMRLFA